MHCARDVGRSRELPCSFWMPCSPSISPCSGTCRLSESCTLGIFIEASSHRHKQSLIPFLSRLFSAVIIFHYLFFFFFFFFWKCVGGGGGGCKFQASNCGLVFLVTSIYTGGHRESLLQNKRHSITQEVPGGLRRLLSGTRVKDQILDKRVSWYSYPLENSKGFRNFVPGTKDRYIFYLIS